MTAIRFSKPTAFVRTAYLKRLSEICSSKNQSALKKRRANQTRTCLTDLEPVTFKLPAYGRASVQRGRATAM